MVAVPDAVEGMGDPAERDRARHVPALLDVTGELVARRRGVLVGRARGVPAQVEGGRAGIVAQAEALEWLLDVQAKPRHREGVAVERRRWRAVLGDGVDDRALVGDE